MTDLEITILCAQAMSLDVYKDNGVVMFRSGYRYIPLHDRAMCFSLIERFDIVIERERNNKLFGVTLFSDCATCKTFVERSSPDLKRAICLCVARMMSTRLAELEKAK